MSALRLVALATFILMGCTSNSTAPREAAVPQYDAAGIARAAVAEFDKNANGSLESGELTDCPALQGAFAAIDSNGDRKLSAEEIQKRVEAYAAGPTGSVPVSCTIRLDGQPLANATVTLVPETFMGGAIKAASGRSDADGRCVEYQIDGKPYTGVAAGLYKIQVTKDGVTIPARYNNQTTLGREVFHDTRAAEVAVELNLSSK